MPADIRPCKDSAIVYANQARTCSSRLFFRGRPYNSTNKIKGYNTSTKECTK